MASLTIKGNGVTLPSPVSIQSNGELIWSENTGRSASGDLSGTALAEKQTFDITWGVLTQQEFETIRSALPKGFFPFQIGEQTLTVYRGPLKGEQLGYIGDGIFYYRSASVSLIQK